MTSTESTAAECRSSYQDWIACDECGQIQQSLPLVNSEYLTCHRCEQPIKFPSPGWLEISSALTVTCLVLFIISNCFVFLGLEVGAFYHEASLLSGVWALVGSDQIILAILVFVTIFLFPLFEIAALCYLVLPCYFGVRLKGQVTLFRWVIKAAPWSMLEIFLLGVLVTSVKLGDMASILLGVSIIAFFALVALLAAAYWYIDKRALWAWLNPHNCFVTEPNEKLFDCEVCDALVGERIIHEQGYCPRCDNQLHTRKPNSLQNTLAYTLAATILYLPANIFPIMSLETLLEERHDTIFSGVAALVAHDLWGIAFIVFLASLVVPVAKLVILFYLVWSVYQADTRAMQKRTWLFKVTEWVGRWSMVDVFVVTLLCGLVQFGFLGSIQPGAALLPFAAVVVLTMLAAHSFDPRLIWDAKSSPEIRFTLDLPDDTDVPKSDTVR